MTLFIGDRSLRLLARRKIGGAISKQLRRLNSASGALFAFAGVALFGLWLTTVVMTLLLGKSPQPSPEDLLPAARLAMALLFVLSVSGHLVHRGLYLPGEEIDRLLSAPIRRSDLIRYRLHAGLGRALFGALFFAAIAAVRVPVPLFGALAAFTAVAFVTIAGQGIALVLGDLEHRLSTRWLRIGSRMVFIVATIGIALAAGLATQGLNLPGVSEVLQNPWVTVIGAPFHPWAALASASPGLAALGWIAVCFGIALASFEAVAHLRLDFRELALDSSASTAKKLRRVQRMGFGASAAGVREGRGSRRVPWLFGRGPLGAVAWRKTASMLRRASSTLGFAAFVALIMVLLGTAVMRNNSEMSAAFCVATAFIGVLYLCSGLRYDFREDLDRLDAIKSWPLSSTRLFAAMLLPEALFVSVLVALAVGVQAVFSGQYHLSQLGVIGALAPLAMLWLAIDNALFLKWPVRFVPGQDGALQNLGRATILFSLRGMLLLCLLGGSAAAGGGLGWLLFEFTGASLTVAALCGYALGLGLLVLGCLAMLRIGGWALSRFDPASDRP